MSQAQPTIQPMDAGLQAHSALAQLGDSEASDAVHSLNAGLLIHRVGQINYDFISEARNFSRELQRYMNGALLGKATVLLYEEALGELGKMHWVVHMRNPSDYSQLLEMVDHDKAFQEIYQGDRLPERGGGNWERMFAEGSFQETVMVPQHGFANEAVDEIDEASFIPPARHQIAGPSDTLLNSGTCGVLILRSFHARYAFRDLARYYLHEWQSCINKLLPGVVTIGQFEEMWGVQDRLYLLLHLSDFDDYRALRRLEAENEELRSIQEKDRLTINGEPASWGALFQDTSVNDKVLLPLGAE